MTCLPRTVLTFASVDEILWRYHSNNASSAVLSHGTIYLLCSSNFWVCGWNPMVLPFKWNLFSSSFTWHHLLDIKLQNRIRYFCWILSLANPESLKALTAIQTCATFSLPDSVWQSHVSYQSSTKNTSSYTGITASLAEEAYDPPGSNSTPVK